jgi:hypothetical protein
VMPFRAVAEVFIRYDMLSWGVGRVRLEYAHRRKLARVVFNPT